MGARVGAAIRERVDAGIERHRVDVDDHRRRAQRVEADVAVVVSLDDQPVRRDRRHGSVEVEVRPADATAGVGRYPVVAAVGGHVPRADGSVDGQLADHGLAAQGLGNRDPQHATGRDPPVDQCRNRFAHQHDCGHQQHRDDQRNDPARLPCGLGGEATRPHRRPVCDVHDERQYRVSPQRFPRGFRSCTPGSSDRGTPRTTCRGWRRGRRILSVVRMTSTSTRGCSATFVVRPDDRSPLGRLVQAQ